MLYIQYAGSAWDELRHIRQAVGFLVWLINLPLLVLSLFSHIFLACLTVSFSLFFSILLNQVIHQKPKKTLKEITNDLCPVSNLPFNLFLSTQNHTFLSKLLNFGFFRYLAYNNYTGSVPCTGMTNMVHTAYHQMWVFISFNIHKSLFLSIPFAGCLITVKMIQSHISTLCFITSCGHSWFSFQFFFIFGKASFWMKYWTHFGPLVVPYTISMVPSELNTANLIFWFSNSP